MSINLLASHFKIPYNQIKPIRDFIGRFIDVDIIDKINSIDHYLLASTWHIDQIKILEDTVLSPDQYLMENYFKNFQELADNAKIIKHFNMY